jgi:hypothetical protein
MAYLSLEEAFNKNYKMMPVGRGNVTRLVFSPPKAEEAPEPDLTPKTGGNPLPKGHERSRGGIKKHERSRGGDGANRAPEPGTTAYGVKEFSKGMSLKAAEQALRMEASLADTLQGVTNWIQNVPKYARNMLSDALVTGGGNRPVARDDSPDAATVLAPYLEDFSRSARALADTAAERGKIFTDSPRAESFADAVASGGLYATLGALAAGPAAAAGAGETGGMGRFLRAVLTSGVLETGQNAGGAYRNVKDQGGSEKQAQAAMAYNALLNGPVNILTEAIEGPLEGSMDAIRKYVSGKGIPAAIARFGLALVKRAVPELLQETGQGITENLTAQVPEDGRPINFNDIIAAFPEEMRKLPQTAYAQGLPGAFSAALLGGAGAVSDAVSDPNWARKGENLQPREVEAIRRETRRREAEGIRLLNRLKHLARFAEQNDPANPDAPARTPVQEAAGEFTPPPVQTPPEANRDRSVTPAPAQGKNKLLAWAKLEADRIDAEAARFSGENGAAENAMTDEELAAHGELQEARKARDFAKLEELRARAMIASGARVQAPPQPAAPPAKVQPERAVEEAAQKTPPVASPAGEEVTPPAVGTRNSSAPDVTPPARNAPRPANGKPGKVVTNAGTEVDTRFKVVEADDLLTSDREGYPAEIQPRDRNRIASRQQIEGIVSHLDPARLGDSRMASDGAPIVGRDNIVESGNGRVMAIREAYKRGAGEGYKKYLADNSETFGIAKAQIEGMKNPVLTRERVTDVERHAKMTQERGKSARKIDPP